MSVAVAPAPSIVQPKPKPYSPMAGNRPRLTQAQREHLWAVVFPTDPMITRLAIEMGLPRYTLQEEIGRWRRAGGQYVPRAAQPAAQVSTPSASAAPASDTADLVQEAAQRMAFEIIGPLLDRSFLTPTVLAQSIAVFRVQRDEWMGRVLAEPENAHVLGLARLFEAMVRLLEQVEVAQTQLDQVG